MDTIKIQHGCGHERVIETPGPEDPTGLLNKLAQTRGAVHRAPAKCPACEAAVIPPSNEGEKQEEGLPSAEDLDAVTAERETRAFDEKLDGYQDPNAAAALDPGTPTGSKE